jgi:hypothetical protein
MAVRGTATPLAGCGPRHPPGHRRPRRGTRLRLSVSHWGVERTIVWLHGLPRLRLRWERRDDIHEAFLGLAICLITTGMSNALV